MIRITQRDQSSFIIEIDEMLQNSLPEIAGHKSPENYLQHFVSEAILTSLDYEDQSEMSDGDLPF